MALPIKSLTQKVHRLSSVARACALFCALCCACALADMVKSEPAGTAKNPAAAGFTWQLDQTHSTASVSLPVHKTAGALRLRIKLEANNLPDDTNEKTNANAKMPEHYISLEVRCRGQVIKTSTFTTYPLGSAGVFRLQVPGAAVCFKPRQATTDVQVKLRLLLADPKQSLHIQGAIFAENSGE